MNTSISHEARRSSPSSLRNREPISQVLQQYLTQGSQVLEIAAGTGEHAVYLSQKLAAANWWPSDIHPDAIDSINAWRQDTGSTALHPAVMLDVSRPVTQTIKSLLDAGVRSAVFDALVCINMIHISPWHATEGLMQTAQALLRDGGVLYLYGPYQRHGQHTAPSNALFDADLQARDPRWGVRELEVVCDLAANHGLQLLDVVSMPANNLSVILRKYATDTPVAIDDCLQKSQHD